MMLFGSSLRKRFPYKLENVADKGQKEDHTPVNIEKEKTDGCESFRHLI